MKLIHYGFKIYDPYKISPIINTGWVKPLGGLWTSPINSKYGWKHWCKDAEFRECNKRNSFTIEINDNAKILIINTLKDLESLELIKADYGAKFIPNFELLAKEYDAIHLTVNGQTETRFSYPICLYGWDCESVLIMNKDCIKE